LKNNSLLKDGMILSKKYGISMLILIFSSVLFYISLVSIDGYIEKYKYFKNDYNSRIIFENALRSDYVVNENITRYAKNLNRFFIYYRNFLTLPEDKKVTEMDIAEDTAKLQQNLYASQQRAIDLYNETAFNSESTKEDIAVAEEQLRNSFEKLIENYRDEVNNIKKSILKEKNENYTIIYNYLEQTDEFVYYINDSVLNRTFKNIAGVDNIEYYMQNEAYLNINLSEISETFNGVNLNTSFELNGITGYIIIPKEQPLQSILGPSIESAIRYRNSEIERYRNLLIKYIILALAAAGAIISLIFEAYRSSGSSVKEGFCLFFRPYLKIPAFLKLFLIVWAGSNIFRYTAGNISALNMNGYGGTDLVFDSAMLFIYIIAIIFSFAYAVYILKDIRRLKNEFEYKSILKIGENLKIIRAFSPFFLTFLWVLMLFVIIIILIFTIMLVGTAGLYIETAFFVIVALFVCAVIFITMDIISSFSKLGYYINIISGGKKIEVPRETGLFATPVNMLNELSEGLYRSLDETLKSERTTTELITNVSHDLKTPLTSIINYVDLLSRLNGLGPEARSYVEVLKQKSYRLKILIDDLFEASKLSSQSVELDLEPVDVIQLYEQSQGELNEKIEESGLDFRLSTTSEKIMLWLDGKKMWRVFENLINNIINYSPKGSRVYVSFIDHDRYAEIILKNVSNHELDFDASELFERFKRGDSSRTTEGSGLGLSIAKNIIDLHGGKMDISIDGDLFKVILILYK